MSVPEKEGPAGEGEAKALAKLLNHYSESAGRQLVSEGLDPGRHCLEIAGDKCFDLALFGKKPDASEMEAWLAPMLSFGEQCGVAVEEELERVGILWWRKPRPVAAGVVGHITDFFTLAFFHDENGGPGQ